MPSDYTSAQLALLPDAVKQAYLDALAAQSDTVSVYEFMDNGQFSGVYTFARNKGTFQVTLPPRTTVLVPPVAPPGQVAVWDGSQWNLQLDTNPTGDLSDQPNPEYAANMAALSAERQKLALPFPEEPPVPNSLGHYPTCVLNQDETAWIYVYPDPLPNEENPLPPPP